MASKYWECLEEIYYYVNEQCGGRFGLWLFLIIQVVFFNHILSAFYPVGTLYIYLAFMVFIGLIEYKRRKPKRDS